VTRQCRRTAFFCAGKRLPPAASGHTLTELSVLNLGFIAQLLAKALFSAPVGGESASSAASNARPVKYRLTQSKYAFNRKIVQLGKAQIPIIIEGTQQTRMFCIYALLRGRNVLSITQLPKQTQLGLLWERVRNRADCLPEFGYVSSFLVIFNKRYATRA